MGQIKKEKHQSPRFKRDLLYLLILIAGKQKDKEQSDKTIEGEHKQLCSLDDGLQLRGRCDKHIFFFFFVYLLSDSTET